MPTRTRLVAAAIAATMLTGAPGRADTVSLDAAKDNTIYQTDDPFLSNGSGDHFFVGRNNQIPGINLRRALIEFDPTGSIPAGSTITGVTLRLNCSRTNAGPQTITMHRALLEWGEGASDADGNEGSGGLAEPGDATWAHAIFPTDPWSALGGDF
ncbi:MAG: hypothetical protein KDA25_07535, partial [Phycisphaerales bacterium]|nr:hypothetical protein [Phycisphaerales bacterium]